jgi:hypothetical protein
MSFVIADAQFGSDFVIDKIQSWSTPSDASPGLLAGYKITVPADPSIPTVVAGAGSITNPYGKRGLPTVTWSIDQTNWYPNGGQILYYNAANAEYITQVASYITCSDTTITFVIYTGYTAAQTVYFQLAIDNPT